MGVLSSVLTRITFGSGTVYLQQVPINTSTGAVGTEGVTGNGLNVVGAGGFKAEKVWNSVWNDVADFQLLADKLEFGKCYFDTKDGARICTERCQMSVIGIASDTFGFGVGSGANPEREVPIAVAGWVLAYVDQEYECGTPLTNDEFGNLTAMTRAEKLEYPERIVAIYKRKEMDKQWGPEGQKIEVKGRHWVKVK
ncbi:MAG: hypothetical protein ACLGHN_13865 [Bacteriovoracia bacterium]